jgi:16S rRNA (adenine1518-N6/adenine1519-N6)-dimethyltransferase
VLEAYVREALIKSRVRPSRARGQHFLVDDSTLAAILRAARLEPTDAVLEIGPGIGSLTMSLAARCWRLYAFELDDLLVKYLTGYVLPETRNVLLEDIAFNKYALERVIAAVKEEEAQKGQAHPLKIVTNLPYQISSAFLHTVVDYRDSIALTVVMLQREVAKRIIAGPGDSAYSSFSLYMQTYLSAQWVCDVPAGSFYPPPKVESAVLSLRPLDPEKQPQPKSSELYAKLVRGVFKRRRKTIANALRETFGHLSVEQVAQALEQAGIAEKARPQELGMAQYVKLADALTS